MNFMCMQYAWRLKDRVADDCELPWGYLEPNPVFLRTAISLNCRAIFQHHIFTNFYLESCYGLQQK